MADAQRKYTSFKWVGPDPGVPLPLPTPERGSFTPDGQLLLDDDGRVLFIRANSAKQKDDEQRA